MTGPEFKAALREIGYTQAEFSRRSGIAVATLTRWATGRWPVPLLVAWLIEDERKLAQIGQQNPERRRA